MNLIGAKISNFRCYGSEVRIFFDDFTTIIGKNDAGKSTILEAIAIFFGDQKIQKDDLCVDSTSANITITLQFSDTPDSIVIDSDFETDFQSEYLLNQEGNLEIERVFDASLQTPKLKTTNIIAFHPSVGGGNDLFSLKRSELQKRAEDLGIDISDINKTAKSPIRAAIWGAFSELSLESKSIATDKEGGKDALVSVEALLPTFALFKADRESSDQDAEAQDPLKAAIKSAVKSIEDRLKAIAVEVEEEVQRVADATIEKIQEMDPSLAETLNPKVSTKKWESLFSTSISGDEGIPFNKRGSGVKRLILLNFFRAEAERAAASNRSNSVIYAIEEPETSQHPNNQRMLVSALQEIASNEGRQVIITTHNPTLARVLDLKSIRYVTREDGKVVVASGSKENEPEISRTLGVLPDHNVKLFIGVEGKNDITFLKTISEILSQSDPRVPNLSEKEISGEVIFFPLGGANLAFWAARLKPLRRPEFHLYDRDNEPPAAAKYQQQADDVNNQADSVAHITIKRELENYIHYQAINEAYGELNIGIEVEGQPGDFDDVPLLVAQKVYEITGAGRPWPIDDHKKCSSKVSSAKANLNNLAVAKMSAERLAQVDPVGEITERLIEIGQIIDRQA